VQSFSSRSQFDSKPYRPHYPFAAIVGMETAKRALMLLAVDAGLQAVLISTGHGSAKTTLARSLAAILADQEPAKSETNRDFPFIDLPLNVTVDSLLGSIDLERTVATGIKQVAPGLLAQADGGLLFIDDINLLDVNLADHVAAALESGVVRVEREGLSAAHSSRFRLVAAYNPEEGEISPRLKDRVGLIVEGAEDNSAEEIAEVISRALQFEKDPRGFVEEFALETAALKFAIACARSRLSETLVTSRDVSRLAEAAITLGVEGNRADVFATRAARANAALAGRGEIIDEDIVTAIQLVLLPRATRVPAPETAVPADDEANGDDSEATDSPHDDDLIERNSRPIEELIIEAMDSPAPVEALFVPHSNAGRRASGKRSQIFDDARGKHVSSASRRNNNSRLAVDATLRAAAPYQLARRDKRDDNKIRITADDLRFKRFKRKAGILFIFAVDASGSMALNRMAQAKGALTRLLQQAYLHRDKVALVSFRRSTAETLLAPTRSVELAKRLVDALPAGGATPIAAALIEALKLARLARLQGIGKAMLLLLTDGRANAGLGGESGKEPSKKTEAISEELRTIGRLLAKEGVAPVVIDTRPAFVSTGEGRALADLIGGRYLYLPRADTKAICKAVTSLSEDVRDRN
jgi:magnesium chelatase subunit D